MSWDEKYLAALGKLHGAPYVTNFDDTYTLEYSTPHRMGGYNLHRYWLLNNGKVLKWSLSQAVWYEIASPRVRRTIMMRAWPEWAPNGATIGSEDFYRKSELITRWESPRRDATQMNPYLRRVILP